MRSNIDECEDWYIEMEIDKMNRDYFSTPIQHSRSTHDYGRSGHIEPMDYPKPSVLWDLLGYFAGGVVVGLMLFAWIAR
jgi:hypothetical protein